MKIRKATKKDFESYFQLEKEFYILEKQLSEKEKIYKRYGKPNKTASKKHFLSLFGRKNSLFLMAEEEGRVAAYMFGFIDEFKPFRMKKGYLDDGIVSEKYRKKGIATELHKEFIKWLKKNKVKTAVLDVAWMNTRAKTLYSKWGYRNLELKMVKNI